MPLSEYRTFIDKLASEKSGDMINNSSGEHASVLAEVMFKYANKSLNIFTGSLYKDTYGKSEVIEQACNFVKTKGGVVRIVFQDPPGKISNEEIINHPLISSIRRCCNNLDEQLFVHRIQSELAEEIPFHFLTMDDSAFRFEPDRSKPVAFASFNKQAVCEQLTGIFERIFSTMSHPVVHA